MSRNFMAMLGVVMLSGSFIVGGSLVYGEEATCGAAGPACACSGCCPKCGCNLVPVCHSECTTKKVTKHEYCCRCTEICVPGVTLFGKKCDHCDPCGACGCNDKCSDGCQDGTCGKCTLHHVKKLVIHPVTKEVPVRKCTVEWVCPNCTGCGCADGGAKPATVAETTQAGADAPSASR